MTGATSLIYSEEELSHFLKKKDQAVFRYLYNNYATALFITIDKIISDNHTSEDVLQEVFVKIWNSIDKYDPGKGRLYTWMMRIARNTAIDSLRTTGEMMKHKLRDVSKITYVSRSNLIIDAIDLRKLVSKLRPECKNVVEMIYYNGYTIVDTGKALSMPEGTVKTHLRRAIAILRSDFNYAM